MEIINLEVSIPAIKNCKGAAEKYKIAVRDALHEVFEQGVYEINLKTLQSADEGQKKTREFFLNSVLQNFSAKVEKIQEEVYETCTAEIYQVEDNKRQELERKDCFERTLVHFLKRLSPVAKELRSTDAIENKVSISYPTLMGLIILLNLGSNRNDKEAVQKLCEKYSYLQEDRKYFHWGGEDGNEPGIYDDEQIKKLAAVMISKLASKVLKLDKSEIIKKISLSDFWNSNENIKLHTITEEEIEELVDILKNIVDNSA